MAVYTEVSDEELAAFVAGYRIGDVLSCKGIAEGVENSNFLLQTESGPYILTLYEKRVAEADLPFFLGLMEHLAGKGLACPTPVRDAAGKALKHLAGRPAAIISFLPGLWPRRVTAEHCREVGEAMARMHLAGADFQMRRANALSVEGWRPLLQQCGTRANEVRAGLADELCEELAMIEAAWPTDLPTGTIHADLFPDNVFFRDGRLSGIIDFYFACTDALAYDVAVCLNAWCFERDNSFNITKGQQLIVGYQSVRPFVPAEIDALPVLARGAALRFLLTRLYDWLNTPPGAFVRPKDPLEYQARLSFHRLVEHASAYGLH